MKKSNIPINTQPMENPPTKFSHAPAPPYGCLKVLINLHLDSITKLLKKRKTEIPINTIDSFDGNKTDVVDTFLIINLTSIKFDRINHLMLEKKNYKH